MKKAIWRFDAHTRSILSTMIEPRSAPATHFPIEATVRDTLYDRIALTGPERALIGTSAFGRLERIQQLGFVSRVWPGARHTRFEHSLGVMHLARLAVDHLRSTPGGQQITDQDARVAIAAALLHDIGHYPFSHAIEELGHPIAPHENVGRSIIEGPEIAPVLLEDWGVDPRRVATLIDPAGAVLNPTDSLLRGVLSGALDMDKLDYLPRDARACNVPYGGVDTARLIDSLTIADVGDALSRRLRIVIGEKGISPLHSLINARQEMFDNVYWHHTNRACMAMLLRATQDALIDGALMPEELQGLDDASLLHRLCAAEMPATTQRLAHALRDRRIHKRTVEIGSRAFELYARIGNLFFDPLARRDVELKLSAALGTMLGIDVPPEAILIDIPKPERWRTDVWVAFERPPVGFSSLMPWRDVVGFGDDDLKRYEEHRRLIRIVAAEPFREVMTSTWERLLMPLIGAAI